MGNITLYTELNPTFTDTRETTLQKILQKGINSVSGGSGAPSGDPGVEYALYVDVDTGDIYWWNDAAGRWI